MKKLKENPRILVEATFVIKDKKLPLVSVEKRIRKHLRKYLPNLKKKILSCKLGAVVGYNWKWDIKLPRESQKYYNQVIENQRQTRKRLAKKYPHLFT